MKSSVFKFIVISLFIHYLSPLKWDIAPDAVLGKWLSSYELCILNLAKNGHYDSSLDIHSQGKCFSELTPHFQNINKRCWLGSRQQRVDNGICVSGLSYVSCTPLINRTSFWKYWSDLPAAESSLGHAGEFVENAHNKGFRIISFYGDSMAVQLSQRLSCDFLRQNASITFFGDYFSFNTGASAILKYSNLDSELREVVLTMFRLPSALGQHMQVFNGISKMHGIDAACDSNPQRSQCRQEFASKQIYMRTAAEFRKCTNRKKWGNMLHIFVLPVVIKDDWEMIPLAQALLDSAAILRSIGSRIVVLSPFAQHFSENPHGLYLNISNRNSRANALKTLSRSSDMKSIPVYSPPCSAHRQTLREHPDSTLFLNTIHSLDSNWRELIGWLDVTTLSNEWYDLHPESGSSGWAVDCTHYGYSPLMYEAVWFALGKYISSFPLINA